MNAAFIRAISFHVDPIANRQPLTRDQEKAIFAKGGYGGRGTGLGGETSLRARSGWDKTKGLLIRAADIGAHPETPGESGWRKAVGLVGSILLPMPGGKTRGSIQGAKAAVTQASKIAKVADKAADSMHMLRYETSAARNLISPAQAAAMSPAQLEQVISDASSLYFRSPEYTAKIVAENILPAVSKSAEDAAFKASGQMNAAIQSSIDAIHANPVARLVKPGDQTADALRAIKPQSARDAQLIEAAIANPTAAAADFGFMGSGTLADRLVKLDREAKVYETSKATAKARAARIKQPFNPGETTALYGNRSLQLIANAVRDVYFFANAGPMTDQQRKAMFAKGGGGGKGPPPGFGKNSPPTFARRPTVPVDPMGPIDPEPAPPGYRWGTDPKTGRKVPVKIPKATPEAPVKPLPGVINSPKPSTGKPKPSAPVAPPSAAPVIPPAQPPRAGDNGMWPGGTPPWVFDPRTGKPNPGYVHPDNPYMKARDPKPEPPPSPPKPPDMITVPIGWPKGKPKPIIRTPGAL